MLKSVTLYTALVLAANTAAADPELEAFGHGALSALETHEAPRPVPDATLTRMDGDDVRLSDYRGVPVVLNFWATWCAPCREEMPALDRLQAAMEGRVEVLTVATGRPDPDGVRRFFYETGIEHLPMLADSARRLAPELGVSALPVTVILDAEGREVARLTGAAEWDAPEAQELLTHLAED